MLRPPMLRAWPILLLAPLAMTSCEGGRTIHDAGFFNRPAADATTTPTDSGTTDDAGAADSGTGRVVLVSRVIDGDTVVLSADPGAMSPDGRPLNGETVRMLGVDAPEIEHPPNPAPADCWGDESHTAGRNLMQGLRVRLEFDATLRDMFDRLLAYVILPDGREANAVMIQRGDAKSFRAFRHRQRDHYDELERQAERSNLGLWTCP